MVDTRFPRLATPVRARNGFTQVSRPRASSVPPEGSKKPEWTLDCAAVSPRKRKRTSVHEDSRQSPVSQFQGLCSLPIQTPQREREVRKAPARATRPRARGLSSADREIVAAGLASSSRASSRTRSGTRGTSIDGRPRRRCASTSRAQSEMPPERLPHTAVSSQSRRTPSRARRNNSGVAKSASRIASTPFGAAAAASRRAKPSANSRGRTREKGKARALPDEHDVSMCMPVDEPWDAESSLGARRNVKRRRLSPRPSLPLDIFNPALDDEDDSQKTAVEEDFEMLESPESLPWVPMNPDSKDSEYVPPGLNALIDDMKRALVLQISARQKAESMHAQELQRRLELEREAARLAAANRALQAKRSARSATTAETLTTTAVENALVADLSRQLTVNVSQDLPQPALGILGSEGPSGHTADAEMAEVTRPASASRDVRARALEYGIRNGSPPGTHPKGGTIGTAV